MPQPCQASPTQGTLIPAAPEMPSCPTAASRGMEEGLDTAHGPLQSPKSDACPACLPSQRIFFCQDLISEIRCAVLHPALNLCWWDTRERSWGFPTPFVLLDFAASGDFITSGEQAETQNNPPVPQLAELLR